MTTKPSAIQRLFRASMHGIGSDIRTSLRRVVREKASTAAIIVLLALGIGPATVAYAVFNHLLFRPVPGVTGPDGLVAVQFKTGSLDAGVGDRTALPAMRDATAAVGLDKLAADGWTQELAVRVRLQVQPTLEQVGFTFKQYFDALGVRPRAGRLISDDEAESGSTSVAVVSEQFCRRWFDGPDSAVGQTITVGNVPFAVVGVADRFRGFGRDATRVGETDIWLPVGSLPIVTGVQVPATTTRLIGRARPGASLTVIEQRMQAAYRVSASSLGDARLQSALPLLPVVSRGLGRHDANDPAALKLFWWSTGLTGALLLIAGVNGGGLVLSRFSRRRADMIVRLAIGAGRFRLARQYLVETLALATLGGAAGLAVAKLITAVLQGVRLGETIPPLSGVEFDARVLGFTGLTTLVAVLLAGVLPSLAAPPRDIQLALARNGRSISKQTRLGYVLLGVGVAVSTVLAVGAGVIGQSFRNLAATNPGARLDGVIELVLQPRSFLPSFEQSASFYSDTVRRLRDAGFTGIATSAPEPLSGNSRKTVFKVGAQVVNVALPREYSVSPGLFDLLSIPILAGRDFNEAEATSGGARVQPMPVVLSQLLTKALFGTESPLGQQFVFERAGTFAMESDTAVVIGVVADIREDNIRADPRPTIYHTRPPYVRTILIRAEGTSAISKIEDAVRSVAPNLPITTLRPLADRIDASITQDRSLALVSGIVAAQAILLAGFGVLAMVSQLVNDRTREFSIRTALGASRTAIVVSAARRALVATLAGMAVGIGAYWCLSNVFGATLYQVSALDPWTTLVASAVIVATTVVAAIVPAYRATACDPLEALKAD